MHSRNKTIAIANPKMDGEKRLASLWLVGCLALAFVALLLSPQAAYAVGPGQPDVIVPDSAFIEAVRDGNIEDVNAALVRGESLDARDKTGAPAIFVALQFSQYEMFRFLIEKGARIKVKDRNGNTLLALLAQTNQLELASLVLSAGADPDRPGANREAPIIVAARSGEAEMVQLLLEHNVDYDATDLTGRTALAIAEERRFSRVVDILRAAGAR